MVYIVRLAMWDLIKYKPTYFSDMWHEIILGDGGGLVQRDVTWNYIAYVKTDMSHDKT